MSITEIAITPSERGRLISISVFTISLMSRVSGRTPIPWSRPRTIQKLEKGMARDEVIRILGEPDSRIMSNSCKCAITGILRYHL